jgi:GWxTD domain-containing protein
MQKVWVALAAAAIPAATVATSRQGGPEPLTVSAVRFYSPASATTTIEGVCELRLGALAAGATSAVRYRVEVAVLDSAGLELQRSDWAREVPAAVARARGATSVETFVFRAAPGLYRVRVRAVPDTGPVVNGALEVRAYARRPEISDLLLATAVRMPASDTSPVAPGEIRRGNLVMRTAPVPHLTPAQASLSYYAEVYPWDGASAEGELRVGVLGPGRRSVIETAPRAVRIDPAGGLTRGTVDLTGLPQGDYVLQLRVKIGDSSVVAEAPFVMGALSAVTAATVPQSATVADPFVGESEAQLDSMYAPLTYLLERGEQGVYSQLAVEGKRRFLEEFWRRRDPTHGTDVNQEMVRFYRSVASANSAFREGGAGQIPGWRTDRGRIFLRYGPWDEILQRPMASPRPYEVWRYTRDRGRYYVFVDQSGVGHYVLIGSNDRREPGRQNWEQYLEHENYLDVAHFLGLATDTL